MDIASIIMLSLSTLSIVAAALLCYKKSTGWYWFLIVGFMLFMMSYSFVISNKIMETVDFDNLIHNKTIGKVNDDNANSDSEGEVIND